MRFSTFKALMIELYEREKEGSAYLDTIPSDIQSAFFDNKYCESLAFQTDLLRRALFDGMGLSEEVEFFLYEWKQGDPNPQIWLEDGTAVSVETFDDYMDYIEREYTFDPEVQV